MAKTKLVGISDRTPGKHAALDKALGRIFGVTSKIKPTPSRLIVVDLTAGNGLPNEHSGTSSPQIIRRHADWFRANAPQIPIEVTFVERSLTNIQTLRQAAGGYAVVAEDSRFFDPGWQMMDFAVVVNDPNSVQDWALPKSLNNAPRMTTIFSTLGCNVGGIKRLPLESRQPWYACVKDQLALLQEWHDAYLVTLEGDAAQWAYLVNWPKANTWPQMLEKAFDSAFKDSKYAIDGVWLKQSPDNFTHKIHELFLTKKERGVA